MVEFVVVININCVDILWRYTWTVEGPSVMDPTLIIKDTDIQISQRKLTLNVLILL